MTAARLYIKEFQNGAYAVYKEPTDGAVLYDRGLTKVVASMGASLAKANPPGISVDATFGRSGVYVQIVDADKAPPVAAAGVCAAPIIQEGVTTWVVVSKTPDCQTCMDRGRVWDGDDGKTKPCPACAVWGVWLETRGLPIYSSMWLQEEVSGLPPRRMSRAAAERYVAKYPDGRPWRAEVRLLPKEGSSK